MTEHEMQMGTTAVFQGMVAQVHNPSTEVKAGGLDVQDYSWLHREFKASLGFLRSCLHSKIVTITKIMQWGPGTQAPNHCAKTLPR